MFESALYAMAPAPAAAGTPAGPAGIMGMVVPIGLMLVVFYFLLWRPQQKQAKERKAILESLKPGDKVLTGSGIFGTIDKVDGDELTLEIAKGVFVRMARHAVDSKK
jgi:preprotein translocase subunit YajC